MARSILSTAAITLVLVPAALTAQGQVAASPQAEISGQAASAASPAPLRAARLTFLAGTVQIQRSDNTGDDTAVLNMPLAEGTRVLTGDYGQAELEFEDGSIARLTPRSALSLDSLALDSAQVAHTELILLGGLAYFELRKSAAATWLLNAGGARISPVENLSLRLDFGQPPATFAVLAGTAQVERTGAFDVEVYSGETLRLDAEDPARYLLTQQILPQSWDSWNESRDQFAADAADKRTAARNEYSGAQGYGWSDLDANGSWYNVPGINSGLVWQPENADEGFDPYGYGNWVWGVGSYVWASGYSWGWTPYRCGHWQFFPGFGWGWTPDYTCGRWAFAGGGFYGAGGIFVRGNYPPRHNPVLRPLPRPGSPHPVIPVRGPDGPRPPVIRGGQVRIAGAVLSPLPAIAPSASHSGSSVGQSLARDFPIDRTTHQPVLGRAAGTGFGSNAAGSRPPARVPHPPTEAADPARTDNRARNPVDRTASQGAAPGNVAPPLRTPERSVAPAPQTPSRITPAPSQSAPPPVRYTLPPPPPAHYNPSPPPPAARPAPASPKPS